jgi:hypothetical protein
MIFKKILINTAYFILSFLALFLTAAFIGVVAKLVWRAFLIGWNNV